MYQVQVQDFEGPLDLLLFLIQREEVDIFDIPIARITDEYLAYVYSTEIVNLDSVADFIYLTSALIRIKVQMLLPQPESENNADPVDPRQALVEQLLEYIRYKNVAEGLSMQRKRRARMYTRGNASQPIQANRSVSDTYINTTIFDLVGALRRVLRDVREEPQLKLHTFEYTIEEQREFVITWISAQGSGRFAYMVHGYSRDFIIATFLAVLEMAQRGLISINPEPGGEDFMITSSSNETAQT